MASEIVGLVVCFTLFAIVMARSIFTPVNRVHPG